MYNTLQLSYIYLLSITLITMPVTLPILKLIFITYNFQVQLYLISDFSNHCFDKTVTVYYRKNSKSKPYWNNVSKDGKFVSCSTILWNLNSSQSTVSLLLLGVPFVFCFHHLPYSPTYKHTCYMNDFKVYLCVEDTSLSSSSRFL